MTSCDKDFSNEASALDVFAATPWTGKAVLLVDLDAFFASVEQLDHPAWRGKPVIVGGDSQKRGVVSTASYEARAYGVHSAMPSVTARKLCPDAIWTHGHFDRYREVSNQVMDILFDETPHVQQVSIDEAFLDVTPTKVNRDHPITVARRIQDRVAQLGVTCSIGIGTTKSIAKMASDMDKPRGLTVVMPGSELNFIAPMPLRALSGIGSSTEQKLKNIGIETLGDLYHADTDRIVSLLGKTGMMILDRVRGTEDTPIEPDDEVKSVSNETSFAHDMEKRDDVEAALNTMVAKTCRRLRRKNLQPRTIAVKVRYANLSFRSAQMQLDEPTDNDYVIRECAQALLSEIWQPGTPLRLIGIATSNFDDGGVAEQLTLFEVEPETTSQESGAKDTAAIRNLLAASDNVKERFGEDALRFGRELRLKDSGTGSSSKNPADYK